MCSAARFRAINVHDSHITDLCKSMMCEGFLIPLVGQEKKEMLVLISLRVISFSNCELNQATD